VIESKSKAGRIKDLMVVRLKVGNKTGSGVKIVKRIDMPAI
jgi:hypothetical protein